MKPLARMSAAELAAYIQTHLRSHGIEVVLSGGACVSIYSSDRYVSQDLDLVNAHLKRQGAIREAMREIGFDEVGSHFAHPDVELIVEFPPGPVSVGSEPIKQFEERRLSTGILRLLSATDCVKDRLAAYYHWKDRQSLEQALLVAKANAIDIDEIERWSKVEGMAAEFRSIRGRLLDRD